MISLDTNVLVRCLTRDDLDQFDSVKRFFGHSDCHRWGFVSLKGQVQRIRAILEIVFPVDHLPDYVQMGELLLKARMNYET